MITPYTSQQTVNDFGLRFSGIMFSTALTANTDTTLTIPGIASSYKMVVKCTNTTWMATGASAQIPTGATFAQTNSEMLNSFYTVCHEVRFGDVIHFITANTGVTVSVTLYSLLTSN